MAHDPELRAHLEWLGYVQPVGLVVAPAALVAAQAHVNRNIIKEQEVLRRLAHSPHIPNRKEDKVEWTIRDLPAFCREFLGWERGDLAGAPGGPALPASLEVALPEYQETLRPTHAVADPEEPGRWLLLIQQVEHGTDLDTVPADKDRRWHASSQSRFERLLRETGIPAGLLANGTEIRLVYAPRGESSGHVAFPVAAMTEVAGRPIVAALHLLLSADRLFTLPRKQRLTAILEDSRKYQNQVSTQLAEQVLAALYELLRGFQAADEATRGELLRDVLREAPQEVYGGLLATLLRLVFVLYAEDRGLFPSDPLWVEHYSIGALFEQLREDAARYPDTMDQRYGAWARLLTLFRLVHDGASHRKLRLPARRGHLFDPDTYDFLEGRPYSSARQGDVRIEPPRVSDGVVYRVLENLLVLDGERLSYRALDVEQIGSVYEAMMGFELRVATGASIAVRPEHVAIDLEALLTEPPEKRTRRLAQEARCDLTGEPLEKLKAARTVDDLLAALERRISPRTPRIVPKGAMLLQPTEERRRSGSHYTPRLLTEPIVRTTLEPLLAQLGTSPEPDRIMELKVCDPAMGSGAFLVAACRYLGDKLLQAWEVHGEMPAIPPDEDPLLHARRVVAERCLYGVDRNPFAVDLAKLSLWLATLAKDHAFTFLDHALCHGDSLVGLTREQIACFDWKPGGAALIGHVLRPALAQAETKRQEILRLGDSGDTEAKERLLADADAALDDLRLAGDALVAAFFGRARDRAREDFRKEQSEQLRSALESGGDRTRFRELAAELHRGPKPVHPFHWEIEFPEVFSRDNPGFDAFVGNPPFGGKNTVIGFNRENYMAWLQAKHEESHGNADLVAHFYRQAFDGLRQGGCFGLIATNTIAQGDTRATGLRWIRKHGGTIYSAQRRFKWPGAAAVVVSVVHVAKGEIARPYWLDDREVPLITAFLFHTGGDDDPRGLAANDGKSFVGSYVLGMGFTFDDDNPDATPIAEMHRLIEKDPRNRDRIFSYIGGEEVNDSPTHAHRRYVINFAEMTEDEARRWPDLLAVVAEKVRPERQKLGDGADAVRRKRNWWLWGRYTPSLFAAIAGLERVIAISRVTEHPAFVFLPGGMVYSDRLVVFSFRSYAAFAFLHSRTHELWSRFFTTTHVERFTYNPTDCFETFPFVDGWKTHAKLEEPGRAYNEYRAALMVRNNEGLTKTYNRFHDPDERDAEILRLRELHEAMDRVVLDAYGWTDIQPRCEFLLDYEDDEENEDGAPQARRRKKPWRYRWPDDLRDEVLGRLLALNRQRAEAERLAGTSGAKRSARRRKKRERVPAVAERPGLFDGGSKK